MDWQPIETAPGEEAVLVWNGESVSVAEFEGARGRWVGLAAGEYAWEQGHIQAVVIEPTHWMPLPPPP